MNAIEIKGLRKKYPGFILGALDLALPQGCILGLVGENGAGKSTTIKLLMDIIRPDAGNIYLLGKEHRAVNREDIGVVLDDVGIPGNLTPKKIGKIMSVTFSNWDSAAYTDYLHRFSLPENKKFREFSRGTKMKLGIAIALSHHPKLLILDEATSGLDPVVRDEILDIFLDFARSPEHTILISSHIISDLEKICDYIAFLHKGQLLLFEEKDALRERYGLAHLTPAQLAAIPAHAILGQKETPYGIEVIVLRQQAPAGVPLSQVDIEQLFIFMSKEVH